MSTIGGWHTKRFDEFGKLFSGSTPSTANDSYWNGHIVWITPADLSKLKTHYIDGSDKQITENGLNACSTHLLPPRSIVLSSRAPIGYVALPTVPFCTNQGCKSVRLRKGFDPEFTYYNILFNIKKIKDLAEGTTFDEISKSALAGIELDFPELTDEQFKIAEILSTLDRAIEQTEILIAKQQRIKTGVMHDLLTRGIDEQGNIRSEQTHGFKDSPLGRIPVEWEATPLDRAINIIDCKHFTPKYAAEGIPIIRPRNIKESGLDMTDSDHVTEKDYALLTDKHTPADGDIVFSRNASFGVPAYLEKAGRVCIGQDVVVMTKKSVNTRFVFFSLKSAPLARQIMNVSGGSTFGRIDLAAIRALKIAVPQSEDEQTAIATRLLGCDESTQAASSELAKLRSLKAALMQDFLTGRKRVTILLKVEPKRQKAYAAE
jgi:type I restriction enzyme, S subunit